MFRPNYYGRQRNNPPEWLVARTTGPGFNRDPFPVNYIAPIEGNLIDGPPWYMVVGSIFTVPNAGITYHAIGRGVYFQYLAAWAPTASIGRLAIGISAIFVRKQEHELIYVINGVDYEQGWGIPINPYGGIFFLDLSYLDGPDVML